MTRDEILSMFRAHRDDWPDHPALVSVAREIERKARESERNACKLLCLRMAAQYEKQSFSRFHTPEGRTVYDGMRAGAENCAAMIRGRQGKK